MMVANGNGQAAEFCSFRQCLEVVNSSQSDATEAKQTVGFGTGALLHLAANLIQHNE